MPVENPRRKNVQWQVERVEAIEIADKVIEKNGFPRAQQNSSEGMAREYPGCCTFV